jgi:hypothetical protein
MALDLSKEEALEFEAELARLKKSIAISTAPSKRSNRSWRATSCRFSG